MTFAQKSIMHKKAKIVPALVDWATVSILSLYQ